MRTEQYWRHFPQAENPRLSSFVDPTFSGTRWLIILGKTQKAETNKVITTRRGKHEGKYMLDNQEGKRLHAKNNQDYKN